MAVKGGTDMKRFVTFLLALILVACLGITAFADGTVTYDGASRKFIFAPGTEESPTNLFADFNQVMPGDTLTDTITVKNNTSNRVKVKLYIRALGAQEGSEDFLSQLKLTVKQKEETVLFEAPADQTAQLTDWVYLGTLYSGGETTLDIQLDVPITLGDEYQKAVGYFDWQFKVEERPVQPSDPTPDTGDDSNLLLYVGLLVVSLAAIFVLLIATKRKKQTSQD